MSTRKVTATITAWIASHSNIGPEHLNGKPEDVINALSYSRQDMSDHGWTRAGTANITVTLVDSDTLITNKVSALKNELKQHRAVSQIRENKLLEQINNLLAITHKPEVKE